MKIWSEKYRQALEKASKSDHRPERSKPNMQDSILKSMMGLPRFCLAARDSWKSRLERGARETSSARRPRTSRWFRVRFIFPLLLGFRALSSPLTRSRSQAKTRSAALNRVHSPNPHKHQ